jgi:hypothetical protein
MLAATPGARAVVHFCKYFYKYFTSDISIEQDALAAGLPSAAVQSGVIKHMNRMRVWQ